MTEQQPPIGGRALLALGVPEKWLDHIRTATVDIEANEVTLTLTMFNIADPDQAHTEQFMLVPVDG